MLFATVQNVVDQALGICVALPSLSFSRIDYTVRNPSLCVMCEPAAEQETVEGYVHKGI